MGAFFKDGEQYGGTATTASQVMYNTTESVADKIDELGAKTGEDIPVNTLTPDTSINSAINACFGRTGSDIPISTGETETIAEAIGAITVRTKDIRITSIPLTAWGSHYYGDVDISSYFTGDESTAEIIGILPTGMTDGGVFTSYLQASRTIRLLSDVSGTISIYTCKVLYVI